MQYDAIKAQEQQYVMNTYGRFPIALVRGQNATVWDSEGKSYIDMAAGIGVNSLGHASPIIAAAIAKQAESLIHTSNLYTTEPMIAVAKKLVEGSGLAGGKVFFCNSGAEANEGAIKLARKYSFDKHGAGRGTVLTLQNSFHGRTIATITATGQEKFHHFFHPFAPGFTYAKANDIANVREHIDCNTCAILMELVQGEGGVLPLDKEFVQQVAELCREYDLLLMIDEVQTGIGRTGSLFCFQQYEIKPDVVTMAKGIAGGLPMGAVLANHTCCDVLTPGTHATTFGGTPLVCAAAKAVLDTVDTPAFLAQVQQKGERLRTAIEGFGSDKIHEVRGKGLMLGIIVDEGKHSDYVRALLENGVLAVTAGVNAVRLLPPLTITDEELDRAISVLQAVFRA